MDTSAPARPSDQFESQSEDGAQGVASTPILYWCFGMRISFTTKNIRRKS